MKARLSDSSGATVYEFESDASMRALLLAIIGQAKHGDQLRPEITLNKNVDAFARAILTHAEKTGAREHTGANGYYPAPPGGTDWINPPQWSFAVLDLVFGEAPNLQWWNLSAEERKVVIARAFYPFRLNNETLEDFVLTVDGRVQSYRNDLVGPPSEHG